MAILQDSKGNAYRTVEVVIKNDVSDQLHKRIKDAILTLNGVMTVREEMSIKEPQKKPIDLSCLIDSAIDCEFSNHPDFPDSSIYIGKLRKIRSVLNPYSLGGGIWYQYCRPRMNHWHHWQGGDCPLPDGFKVEVKLRSGNAVTGSLELLTWSWDSECGDQDIIAFKVLPDLDLNYCWPWECKDGA